MERNTPFTAATVIGLAVAAGAKIEAGKIVVLNATGYAQEGSTALNLVYVGRAEQTVDNTGGVDGELTIETKRKAAFKFKNSGDIVQADLMKTCYIVDSETVAKDNGGNTRSAAGVVVGIDDDGVWVE